MAAPTEDQFDAVPTACPVGTFKEPAACTNPQEPCYKVSGIVPTVTCVAVVEDNWRVRKMYVLPKDSEACFFTLNLN